MATVELTGDNFESVVGDAGLALVDFWAAWCGPCRMFGPVFEQASEANPDAVFGKVDTEAQQALAELITKAREIDMDQVRATIAAQDARQAGAQPAS